MGRSEEYEQRKVRNSNDRLIHSSVIVFEGGLIEITIQVSYLKGTINLLQYLFHFEYDIPFHICLDLLVEGFLCKSCCC